MSFKISTRQFVVICLLCLCACAVCFIIKCLFLFYNQKVLFNLKKYNIDHRSEWFLTDDYNYCHVALLLSLSISSLSVCQFLLMLLLVLKESIRTCFLNVCKKKNIIQTAIGVSKLSTKYLFPVFNSISFFETFEYWLQSLFFIYLLWVQVYLVKKKGRSWRRRWKKALNVTCGPKDI